MASDRDRGSEKTIEREDSRGSQQDDQRRITEETIQQLQEQLEKNEQADYLSEVVFDFAFVAFEAMFAILSLVMIVVTGTTAISLLETASVFMMLAGIFEIFRQLIKRLDKFIRFSF